jgi:hypothetical protein
MIMESGERNLSEILNIRSNFLKKIFRAFTFEEDFDFQLTNGIENRDF